MRIEGSTTSTIDVPSSSARLRANSASIAWVDIDDEPVVIEQYDRIRRALEQQPEEALPFRAGRRHMHETRVRHDFPANHDPPPVARLFP